MFNVTKLFLLGVAVLSLTTMGCNNNDPVEDVVVEPNRDSIFAASFAAEGNQAVADLGAGFASTTIVPTASAASGATAASDAFFTAATYRGAVAPGTTMANAWFAGWSSYESILTNGTTGTFTEPTTIDTLDASDFDGQVTVNLNKNTLYHMDGRVIVGAGDTLNIEAGTIIKALATPTDASVNATVLIVSRDGYINASGTALEPIIFTAMVDDGTGAPATVRGEWGGVVILGKAELNSAAGETAIEGVPTNVTEGLYGGTDNAHNSGVFRYVSIRHGGADIGAGNELNGLSLGGVGIGTTLDHIEVIANVDDGIEWFGGTAQMKYALVLFCGDDSFDYDEGFRGKTQFAIIHQDPASGAADRGGEHDGGTTPEDGTPYATPTFYNVTSIGNSGSRTITFRDNAGGYYYNSIFYGFGEGIDIEYLAASEQDSYKQFRDGKLILNGNLFSNIGSGSTADDLFTVSEQ